MPADLLHRFRQVAFLEGISFLVLLGIAMPLKYLAGEPLAVRIVGTVHGVLFLVYGGMVGIFVSQHGWSIGRAVEAMVLSVVPFGTFYLDRRLRRDAEGAAPAGARTEAAERP